jgi:hypothetical protein
MLLKMRFAIVAYPRFREVGLLTQRGNKLLIVDHQSDWPWIHRLKNAICFRDSLPLPSNEVHRFI